jgi:dihydrolipoamide dehydrogenase
MKQRKNVVFEGTGRLLADHVVEVTAPDGSTQQITGTNVVLAAGSVPRTLAGFDVDGGYVLTSDEVLALRELPATAVVIGGGAIGCEFVSMLATWACR